MKTLKIRFLTICLMLSLCPLQAFASEVTDDTNTEEYEETTEDVSEDTSEYTTTDDSETTETEDPDTEDSSESVEEEDAIVLTAPDTVSGLTVSATTSGYVSISWDKVSDADGYQVYRSVNGGSYSLLKTTTSDSLTDKTVSAAKIYRYKVRAYITYDADTVYGSYSSAAKVTAKPAKATLKSASRSSSLKSVTLKWNKVSDATGYQIYRSVNGGSYKKIKTITNASTVTYTDTSVSPGKTYRYKIRAYKKSGSVTAYGAYSSVKSTKTVPAKAVISKVSLGSGTTGTISWEKVSGASGYVIYRSTSKSGTYSKIKTITSGSTTSYKMSDIKSTKRYYYKIRAYKTVNGKNYYGSYSDIYTQPVRFISTSTLKSLDIAGDTDKIIVVNARSTSSSKAVVQYFKKTNGTWKEVLRTEAVIGKNGIGKTKEGDKKTPTGVYHFTKLFGVKSNPGTIMSYTKLTNSMYWCGGKTCYNQFVNDATNSTHKKKCSHSADEHLKAVGSLYNYVAALDYNSSNTYGKGSAIFLHCKKSTSTYTSGCIGISESSMKKIIKDIDEDTVIIIDTYKNIKNY